MIQMRRWKCGMAVGILVVGLFLGLLVQPADAQQLSRKSLYNQRGEVDADAPGPSPSEAFQALETAEREMPEALAETLTSPVCKEVDKKLDAKAGNKLRALNPGAAPTTDGNANNLSNFLSLFGLSLTQTESDDDKEQGLDLVADVSFVLPSEVKERNGMLLLKVNSDPEVSELIRMQITDDEGTLDEDRLKTLDDELEELDDVALTFSWNLVSRTIGRSPKMHEPLRKRLFQDLEAAARPAIEQDLRGRQIGSSNSQELLQLVEMTVEDKVKDTRLEFYESLVSNQPQLIITAEHRDRKVTVGADVTSLTVEWQQPLGPSINRFWKHAELHDCRTVEKDKKSDCVLQAFADYMKTNNNTDKATNGLRSSFSLSYQDIGSIAFSEEIDGQSIEATSDGGQKLIVSAGIGRSFQMSAPETEDLNPVILKPARWDLNLSYEDVSDDPERQSRFKAELAFSYQAGTTNPFLTFVYVNKPEFLAMEDLDEELSARFGFKFAVPGS